ncbi:hypothetical protein ACQHGF_004069 [Escherichia coli]
MGSWGMEALESDEGLDLINWVEEQLQDDSTFDAESIVQRLSQHEDLFGFQGDEEFLYDNNVIGLVELIIQKAAGEKITSSKQIDQLDSYRLTSIFSKKLQGRLQTIDDTHEWIMLFEGRAREKAKADAPRDKCTLSCAINGIHAAFHYLKKNYISGCVMTVPTGW